MTPSSDPTPTDPIERAARRIAEIEARHFGGELREVDWQAGRLMWRNAALSAAGLLAATPPDETALFRRATVKVHDMWCACGDWETHSEEQVERYEKFARGVLAERAFGKRASSPAPADDEAALDPTWHEVRDALLAQVRPSSSEADQFIARDPLAALADTLTPESIDSVRTAVMRSTHHGEGRPGESGELTMLRALIAAVRAECGHESARRVAWDRDEHARNLAATQAGFQQSLDDIRAGIVTLESVRDLVDHRRKTLRMDDLVAALSPKDKP